MFEKGTSVEITFSHHIESKSCYLNQAIQNEVFQTMTIMTTDINRSNRPEVFCKKGVLRKFTKFTGKHLCQILFFNKVADLRPATLLKKRLWHNCFAVNFVRFLRTPFLIEHLWWLLLY